MTTTTQMNVLLVESERGAGALQAETLEKAGHHVHRCYPQPKGDGGRVAERDRHLCTAVTSGHCPLEDGGIDVALLVRGHIATQPGASEGGVTCAIRAGIPVVEDGPSVVDPYEPWLAGRVKDDVVRACTEAVETGFEPLRDEIGRCINPLLGAAGIDPEDVSCSFKAQGPTLRIVIAGPPTTQGVEHALSVRVIDALRSGARTYGQVDVSYSETT